MKNRFPLLLLWSKQIKAGPRLTNWNQTLTPIPPKKSWDKENIRRNQHATYKSVFGIPYGGMFLQKWSDQSPIGMFHSFVLFGK